MSSAETTSTNRGMTETTDTSDAGSAAERLGGPSEGEQTPDTARRAEESPDTARTREESPDMARMDAESPETARRAEESQDAAPRSETAARGQADTGDGQPATLIAPERAEDYNSRWTDLKGQFVDEPRAAVRGANELVGEVLDELEELFRRQRANLEEGLDSDQTSTEDLRLALGRYRSFFDRLLSF
jgi:hypothetical protein